jgi:hypothetical protein
VRTCGSALQWRSSEAVAMQRVEHLDNVIGLMHLDDVMGVGRDGQRSDEAEEH